MNIFIKQYGPLVGALLLIGGAIVYLQSQKPDRAKGEDGASDILIEETLREETSSTPEANIPPVTEGGEKAPMVVSARDARIAEKAKKYERVKEISTPDGFINTPAFTLKEYVGKKVILVDFWTYSCINCRRTTPYLNTWYDSYEKDGLVIVGVHTPEFDFEKDYANVAKATKDLGITFPVVLDNDYSTWTAYKNQYWPRKYLIDIDGFIVYDHIGEGGYDETEQKIVSALNERAQTLGMSAIAMSGDKPQRTIVGNRGITPETYLGWGRQAFMTNPVAQNCYNARCSYALEKKPESGTYTLAGEWTLRQEFVKAEQAGSTLTYNLRAQNIYIVAGADMPALVEVFLDGKKIEVSREGEDVKDGVLTITDKTIYHVGSFPGVEDHVLLLRTKGPGFELFTFTFG